MFIERDTVARTLHTLFLNGYGKKISFQRFKCMRILKLIGHRIKSLDDSIGELVHLRYLDLSDTKILVLPASIGKLYHLQNLKLHRCYGLHKFPKSMRNLISLRHCTSEASIPANILGQLTSLRTLEPSFKVHRKKGHGIEQLSRLKHLNGRLRIFNLHKVMSKEDAVNADLFGKKNLYEIAYSWNGANRNDKDVLEGLQPPAGVRALRIEYFSGDNFPEWVMKMTINIDGKGTPLGELVSITLRGCRNCLSIPTLEHLPHLRDLELREVDNLTCLRSSLGVTASTKPLSPSLRSLKLLRMRRLENWIDGASNSSQMISPVLERLEIFQCPNVIVLDECHPHPLVSLEIRGCTGLVSIKIIQGLTSLEYLRISHCRSLLRIINLPNQCHSLKFLRITDCDKLTSLPHEIFDCFAFLNELELGPFSKELDSFPSLQGIEKLRDHLHSLKLYGLDHWKSIPEEIQHLTSLTRLTIHGFRICEVPTWLTSMSSLQISFSRFCIFSPCNIPTLAR